MAKGSRRRSLKGGFYPSIMHGIATTGPYFTTVAVAQGVRLIRNNTDRMRGRVVGSRKNRRNRRQTRRRY